VCQVGAFRDLSYHRTEHNGQCDVKGKVTEFWNSGILQQIRKLGKLKEGKSDFGGSQEPRVLPASIRFTKF
jgi:hypothetical protein